MSPRPLEGITVVALEQAVAAPYCTSRLADMGARVIKIERAEGDFARGYDKAVYGESSYFVWINRGKQSIALNLKDDDDLALLKRIIARADIFIQNLAPGAAERLGLGASALRERFPRLITCNVSGYGPDGPAHTQKAYDLLVQAESGLVAVSGAPGEWGRIGVSLCDIGAGMNSLIGILEALTLRARTGQGGHVEVSLFGTAAELMGVPYLQTRYGGQSPQRVGLRHPTVAPYGYFRCADGREIVISIQNEREWVQFCREFMADPGFATDERFNTNPNRCANRAALDERIQQRFNQLDHARATERLTAANTAYGSISSVDDLISHPQLRTTPMPIRVDHAASPSSGSADGMIDALLPAVPYQTDSTPQRFAPAPSIDEHGAAIRAEFGSPAPGSSS